MTSARARRCITAGVIAAAPGTKASRDAPLENLDADIGGAFACGVGIVAFEIKRHLARHDEEFGLDAIAERKALARNHGVARDHVGSERGKHRIVGDGGQSRGGGVKRERRALAQTEQARGLIDLGAGQNHGGDRAAAQSLAARMQVCVRLDLRAQVG